MRDGWQTRVLADVCITIQDGAHESPKKQFDSPGEGRFLYITSKNIRTNYLDLNDVSYVESEFHNRIYPRCRPSVGDVLLTKDGANTGNVALNTIEEPFSLLSSVCLMKTNPSTLDPSFLCYYLQSPDGFVSITGKMTGAAIKRIILRDIKRATIPLPPLPEQRRIVGVLDKAVVGIATAATNAEKNSRSARELFESHVYAVVTQQSEGWEQKRLGELCSIARGGSPRPIKEFLTAAPDGINWIKIGDATASGKYIFKTEVRIIPEGAKRSRVVHDGDFLLSNSMSFGRPYIMRTSGCIHDGWLVLSDYASQLDQDYLYYVLGSRSVFQQFDRLAAGSTVRNLNIDLASRVKLPVPPLKLQQQIARQFASASADSERLESIYQRKLTALDELKQSLLHQAFSGQL
jgi:type I restriction enzyme S subunit